MFDIKGKYGTAKIFTDVIDDVSLQQVQQIMDTSVSKNSTVRMMPNIHAGNGCAIGTTMTWNGRICPNLVGFDIGCGIEAVKIRERNLDLDLLDRFIRTHIPSGNEVREFPHPYSIKYNGRLLKSVATIDEEKEVHSLGTLGVGSHFIEIDRDEQGFLWLIVHTGSRNVGVDVATFYQNIAYEEFHKFSEEERRENVDKTEAEDRRAKLRAKLAALKKDTYDVPKDLSYLTEAPMECYLMDMKYAQEYADMNRKTIVDDIAAAFKLLVLERFTCVHNYVDMKDRIIRKGAVAAHFGQSILIPINMRDGSLICTGLGNEDWNFSAPCGAGIIPKNDFINIISDTVRIDRELKPIYTFKA